MDMVYFDNSATTKPHKEVILEVDDCMENYFANPSSAHRLGLDAEKKIKSARGKIANLVGASTREIIFTSGGSESNNTAIRGLISSGNHIIASAIEHPSVHKTTNALENQGFEVTYVGTDSNGIIKIDELKNAIRPDTKLVTIMHVNNEIGSIQPIDKITKVIKEINKRTKVHVDAIQSFGKMRIDVKSLDVDMMSLSAHKIHGPKGVGALYIKEGLKIDPIISGGGQEMDIRSGTENVPGISGFGIAAEIMGTNITEKIKHVNEIKDHFLDRLSEIKDIIINSPSDGVHIGNILNVSFEGVRGEVLLHALEDYNIYVSTGSACSSKKSGQKNHVLTAIGLKQCHIEGAIRFSFSYLNTIDEVDYTVDVLKKILPFLRRIKK